MKIKTSELIDESLDWAVAMAVYPFCMMDSPDELGRLVLMGGYGENCIDCPKYSTDFAQGGPIIEQKKIRWNEHKDHGIYAWIGGSHHDPFHTPLVDGFGDQLPYPTAIGFGKTLLIAAMRCYVASELGEEVEIPDGLLY